MKQIIRMLLTGGLVVYTISIFLFHESFTRRMADVNDAVAEIEKEIAEYKDQQKRKVDRMVEKRAIKLDECLAFQPLDAPAKKPTWRERWFKSGTNKSPAETEPVEAEPTKSEPAQGDRQ